MLGIDIVLSVREATVYYIDRMLSQTHRQLVQQAETGAPLISGVPQSWSQRQSLWRMLIGVAEQTQLQYDEALGLLKAWRSAVPAVR